MSISTNQVLLIKDLFYNLLYINRQAENHQGILLPDSLLGLSNNRTLSISSIISCPLMRRFLICLLLPSAVVSPSCDQQPASQRTIKHKNNPKINFLFIIFPLIEFNIPVFKLPFIGKSWTGLTIWVPESYFEGLYNYISCTSCCQCKNVWDCLFWQVDLYWVLACEIQAVLSDYIGLFGHQGYISCYELFDGILNWMCFLKFLSSVF